MSPMVKKYKL